MNKKFQSEARVARLAKICSNVALFSGIVLLLFGLMPVFKLVYYVFMLIFAAVVLTVFLLSLIFLHPFDVSFLNSLFGSEEVFTHMQTYSFKAAPYVCAVAVVLGIVAIVLISRDKSVRKKGRIVAASLAIGFAAVGTVAIILGVAL